MNISYRWLQKLAPGIVEPAESVAERLTAVAVPVDEAVPLGGKLEDIVVGRVAEVRQHPNADRLVVCQVDTGGDSPVQVVTGAPNVEAGAFYPFVGVGTTLPSGLTIKKAKLRGEVSEGMLCSERELELGRDQDGIMRLEGDLSPGTPLVEALGLDDYRLILDITANRPDLLGHVGVAREIAPGGQADIVLPEFPDYKTVDVEFEAAGSEGAVGGVEIALKDTDGCSRFTAAAIRGVKVGPSPEWLARDLRAVGLQPINNVVDATNYVMMEMNQPVHAYDLPTIGESQIIVRRAKRGETVTTLDGKTRELDPEVLVIGDGTGVNGVAGLMGGQASEVTEETVDLLLEAAFFDPLTVRRGARNLGMDTDASYRFQRGVDGLGTHRAMARVVNLVLATAGGELDGKAIDLNPQPREPLRLTLRPTRAVRLLGVEMSAAEIRGYLEPLGFDLDAGQGDALQITVPGWRPDVEREVDLIEEVARRHGYDRFPDALGHFRPTDIPEDEFASVFHRLREFFVGAGFLESRSSPFAPPEEGDVAVLNPLSEVESHLRSSLLTSLVHAVERNFAQGQRDVRLFELGTTFHAADGAAPDERLRAAAIWTGMSNPRHWSGTGSEYDVWDAKWALGSVAGIAVRGAELRPIDSGDGAYAGLDAFGVTSPDGQILGWVGRVPADRIDSPRWAAPVWGLELDIVSTEAPSPAYRPLPVYPAVERDIAVIVPRTMLAAEVEAVIRANGPDDLRTMEVFDVYEGDNIPEGTRSIAWRLRFRSPDRTLTDKGVDAAVERIVRALRKELSIEIRGS